MQGWRFLLLPIVKTHDTNLKALFQYYLDMMNQTQSWEAEEHESIAFKRNDAEAPTHPKMKYGLRILKLMHQTMLTMGILIALGLIFFMAYKQEDRELNNSIGLKKRIDFDSIKMSDIRSSIKTAGKSPQTIFKKQVLSSSPINIFDPDKYTRLIISYFRVALSIYKNADLIEQRTTIHKKRVEFMDRHTKFPNVWLAKYNMKIESQDTFEMENDLIQDYLRLEDKYKLNEITTELPMCVISPSYNNNKNFRVEYNLNSIFSQNYSNFQAVIIDDGSNDGTGDVMRSYRDFYNISANVGLFIFNKERKKATQNIYLSSMKYCKPDSIGLILDGDDQILGKNTLKVFNAVYQRKKAEIVYSNSIIYELNDELMRYGFSLEYTQEEKDNQLYRKVVQKFSHFRTFKVSLMQQVKLSDLQTQDGKFFPNAADYATMYPMLELACGHVHWINEYNYLYALNTGINNYDIAVGTQVSIGQMILNSPPYPCSKKYQI